MGLLTEALNELRASLPFPGGAGIGGGQGGRTYLGWSDNAYLGNATQAFRLPGERDVRASVGDGGGTALISAAVNWMFRELVPAQPVLRQYGVEDLQHEGVPTTIRRHAALDLLQRPNPYYDGTTMRMACALSYLVDGNVYKWKIRSPMGRVVAEWWLPHWCVVPWGNKEFIDYYRYSVLGQVEEIDPADIEHLRFGLDPANPRRGLSPIRGVLREVYTDEEYARFSASLAHNFGFPGAVIIPGKDVVAAKESREEIKKRFDDEFGADGRGRSIVLNANAEVKFLQWSPKDLDLSSLRDVPEERVSSVTGIPAAVLGFGTGLQQVKVGATMRELRSMGWEGALIPFLTQTAQTDTAQLLPDFLAGRELARTEVDFDLSKIAALSEMHLRKAETESMLVRSRIKKVDEARMTLGMQAVGGDDGGFQASPGVGAGFKADPVPAGGATETESDENPGEGDEPADNLGQLLSEREEQVVRAAARGSANKQIAEDLSLSERTVERHLASAKAKLGVASRAELGYLVASATGGGGPQHEGEVAKGLHALAVAQQKNADALLQLAKPTPPGTIVLNVDAATFEKADERIAAAMEKLEKSAAARDTDLKQGLANSVDRAIEKGLAKVKPAPAPPKVIRTERSVKRDSAGRIARVDETPIYEEEV
jgi:phage portal protein BeeE/DNA-binding CsgD family transcriptional regulator